MPTAEHEGTRGELSLSPAVAPSRWGVPSLRDLRELTDVRFESRLGPALIPLVYLGSVLLTALGAAVLVWLAVLEAWWLGLLTLAAAPVVVLAVAVLARLGCELAWSVFDLDEHTTAIAARFPHLESTIDEVASDMPNLGFLRRGASNRERWTSTMDGS